jgi:hypothetical protein
LLRRGTPTALCDAEPTGTGATPSSLSGELGASAAVFNEQSQSTVASAAGGCDFELFTDADTDGVGQIDTGVSDVQSVEPSSSSGWEGVRIHRVVSGQMQTDRHLVHRDGVVLLVVLRADTDAEIPGTADDFLAAVAQKLG